MILQRNPLQTCWIFQLCQSLNSPKPDQNALTFLQKLYQVRSLFDSIFIICNYLIEAILSEILNFTCSHSCVFELQTLFLEKVNQRHEFLFELHHLPDRFCLGSWLISHHFLFFIVMIMIAVAMIVFFFLILSSFFINFIFFIMFFVLLMIIVSMVMIMIVVAAAHFQLFGLIITCLSLWYRDLKNILERQNIDLNYNVMLVRSLFRSTLCFGRGKFSRKVDSSLTEQQQSSKMIYFQRMMNKFDAQDLLEHEDIMYEEDLYGGHCWIIAATENNWKSAEFARLAIQRLNPNLIILGGINDTAVMGSVPQNPRIRSKPYVPKYLPKDMFCKKQLIQNIHVLQARSIDHFYEDASKLWFTAMPNERRMVIDTYRTAAYSGVFEDNLKLAYGKPSDQVIFQDLMLLPLKQLQQIFENTINEANDLLPKSQKYRASYQQELVHLTAIKLYPEIFSKQITFMTSLANRLTKIQKKVLVIVSSNWVERIAENIHKVSGLECEQIYRGWITSKSGQTYEKYNTIMEEKNVDQLLEKFAILSILLKNFLQFKLVLGKNIFLNTIFGPLFKDMNFDEIIRRYGAIKKKYANRFLDLQRNKIINILNQPYQSLYNSLEMQFDVLKQRNEQFPMNVKVKNKMSIIQQEQQCKLLHQKIDQIVQNQCNEVQKQLYESIKRKELSKQGIIFYTKLIGKANVRMDQRIKLPLYHFGAFRGIYAEYLQKYLLGEQKNDKQVDPHHDLKVKLFKDKLSKVMKQFQDDEEVKKYLLGQAGKGVKIFNLGQNEFMQNMNGDGEESFEMDQEMMQLQNMFEKIQKEIQEEVEGIKFVKDPEPFQSEKL